MQRAEFVILGAGVYGLALANHLVRKYRVDVVVVERESEPVNRASLKNQARIHGGYHYPLSIQTGISCTKNYQRFLDRYPECVVKLEAIYAVANTLSKISPMQFEGFCNRVSAPLEPITGGIAKFFNQTTVDRVYRVKEVGFNAVILRNVLMEEARALGVRFLFSKEVQAVSQGNKHTVTCHFNQDTLTADVVYCAAYAGINPLLVASGLDPIPMEMQLTELALVEVPEYFQNLALTVVCGPFFSLFPYPAAGLHSLSHVRYSPRKKWVEKTREDVLRNERNHLEKKVALDSNFDLMVRDGARYVGSLEKVKYSRSLFELKALALENQREEGRPILEVPNHGIENFHIILGSKIDNIFDLLDRVDSHELRRAG